ncbi:MAG: ATP-dependent zinc metalloprotease FtsH, partial [Mycobacterium sp.]
IETAHTEAWEILTEYRDVLDTLAGELLEKETLHRAELEAIFADVEKRPRLTLFDDFGGRIPSDKPPIKTPGELAIERGEPWPKPAPEPAFKAAIAAATRDAAQADADRATNGANGSHGAPASPGEGHGAAPHHPAQPDYGAPAGWHAPGWPPPQQAPGYRYPPPSPAPTPPHWPQAPHNYTGHPGQLYPPHPPYAPPGAPAPEAGPSVDPQGGDPSPSNPPTHG